MGGCVSTTNTPARAAKVKSNLTDKQIEKDSQQFKQECKVLLLGTGGCGKSTIVKHFKIIHQNGFSEAERAEYRPVIYKNVIDSAQAVLSHMRKIRIECTEESNRILAEKILDYKLDATPQSSASKLYFSPEIADAIYQVWKDPIISKVMDEHSSDFYLAESAGYFINEVQRIGTPGYLPSETDVLKAKQKSLGITETRFTISTLSYTIRMFEIGYQRTERRKWIHCFANVNSIIFCTALDEYDQVLLEEKSQGRPHPSNRMAKSLILFESVINSRWFWRTSIILILNKIDVFMAKLPKVPLERYFPHYTGGTDSKKATQYILGRFKQANRADLGLYPHVMQATDPSSVRLVFLGVKDTILRNTINKSGIL